MNEIGNISFLGLIFGMIGTSLGGLLGAFINITSNKFISFILEFAAGLMTAVICFDLIPESLDIISISLCLLGIFLGTISMFFCDNIVELCFKNKNKYSNSLLKTGIIILIGLSLHNFPEGLAIGAGFEVSNSLRSVIGNCNCITRYS